MLFDGRLFVCSTVSHFQQMDRIDNRSPPDLAKLFHHISILPYARRSNTLARTKRRYECTPFSASRTGKATGHQIDDPHESIFASSQFVRQARSQIDDFSFRVVFEISFHSGNALLPSKKAKKNVQKMEGTRFVCHP